MQTIIIILFSMWGVSILTMALLVWFSCEEDPYDSWPYNIPESEIMGG